VSCSCQQKEEKKNPFEQQLNEIERLIQVDDQKLAQVKIDQLHPALNQANLQDIDSCLNHARFVLYSQLQASEISADRILNVQKMLATFLDHPMSQQQRASIYLTLASLYCLLPDTLFLANPLVEKAILLSQSQLKEIFETRNTYDPKIFAIYLLKKKIRSLILLRGEISMKLQRWEEALSNLDEYSKQEGDALSLQIEKLEKRRDQIAPFVAEQSGGKNAYHLEWNRIQIELVELKKVLRYKKICEENIIAGEKC
jgi:hypothetical protein